MVFKIEGGPDYKGPKERKNSEYLPFVKVPTDSLPAGVDIGKFNAFKDTIEKRERYILNVRIHAKDGQIVLEENQSSVTPAPTLSINHDQLSLMENEGLKVVIYDLTAKTQDVCLIKPQ